MAFPFSSTEGPRNTQNWLHLASKWAPDSGIVSSLPTNPKPAEGDRCTFKAAAGVYWELVYTGEATYPWAKIGGPPLQAGPVTKENVTNTVASVVGSPTITAPVAMEFSGYFGAAFIQARAEGAASASLQLIVGGAFALQTAVLGGSNFETFPALRAINPFQKVAKGQSVAVAYLVQGAAKPYTYLEMYVEVDPVRVG